MLCTLFFRLGVSPRNLTTLPFFLGSFMLHLFVVLQCCWGRLVRCSLHCERITVCCPLLLGFFLFFPWRQLGIHIGGAGHGHLCRISSGRWHMVSVVVVGAFKAGVVLHIKISHFHLVAPVKISHFHRAGAVLLDSLVRDAHRCCIVTMDWGGQLGISHLRLG